jgi:uncharacterized membrane protein HdeD (DUF308 family)
MNADRTHVDDARFLFAARDADDTMTAALARNWWALALRGVFGILFGILAFIMPDVTLAALVLLFAAYMLVDGVFAIVAGVRAARRHERWVWLIFEGIVDLVASAIAFLVPLATVLAFVMLTAAWAIISGVMLTIAAFRLQRAHGRWLMGLTGILSGVWGVLLVVWPAAGALVLTWWIGGYALVFGAMLLVLAVKLRRRHRAGVEIPVSRIA